MTQITHGSVSVEDGAKAKEEYAPPRKVRVELHFSIPEDAADPVAHIADAGDLAHFHVNRLLKPITDKDRMATAAGLPTTDLKAEPKAPKTTTRIKPKETAPAPTVDPAQIDVEDLTSGPAPAAPESVQEEMEDITSAPAAPITDAELNSAVQKKNATLQAPPKIRELIGSFNPDPKKQFQLREIPQASRANFLEKLEALK